jgi:periplasmic protein TonB
MLADSLLDSHWANRSHRGWTTLASFASQVLAVGILLLLPLIYGDGLPRPRSTIVAPLRPPPGQRTPAGQHTASRPAQAIVVRRDFTAPAEVLLGVDHGPDIPVPDLDACLNCVPGGTGPVATNSVFGSVGLAPPPPPPPPPPKPTAPSPRVSVMMEGNLVYQVQPVYPPMARAARIQGAVVLRAIINKGGTIEDVQVVSGHPMLVKAAIDAVSQWRYRPYILNSQPIEVETHVTVNFVFSGG